MRKLYRKIELELDKVKFGDIWSGFSRTEFALYNNEMIFLKDGETPYDRRFLGNTSIDFKGSRLAIWKVEDVENEDSKVLASNIVHEMFHSYQYLNDEARFPNDLKGLDYPMELNNFEIKYRENKLIVSCFNEIEKEEKVDLLEEIISLRNLRRKKYGENIDYEFEIETIEGSAEYCASKALKYICKDLYKERMDDYKNKLDNDTELLFHIRRASYYTGTLFLLILDDLNIDFTQEIKGQTETIYKEVSSKIKHTKAGTEKIDYPEIEDQYIKFTEKRKNKFEDFFKNDYDTIKIDALICGYDPMNMIKDGDMILCSHFIMMEDKPSKRKVFLKGPVVVKLVKDTLNNVKEYYTIAIK